MKSNEENTHVDSHNNNNQDVNSAPNPFNENDQIVLHDTNENEAVVDVLNNPVPITSSAEIESNIEKTDEGNSSIQSKLLAICNPLTKIFLKLGQYFQNLISKLSDKVQIQSSYKYFLIFLALGLLLLFFSLFCIPFIIFNPGKYLRLLSFSNILIMLSFLYYYGSKDFFAFLVDKNRTGVMFSHILGVLCSLFVSLFIGGYFLRLLLDVVLSITTIMFILTLIPGGQGGIAGIQRMLLSPLVLLYSTFKGKIFGDNSSVLPQ
jgi:hypothetical protein